VRAGCGQLTGAAAAAIDPASGHCYVAWAGPLNWTSSQRECLRNGGDLVSINSQAENDVVKNLVGGTAWIGYVAAPGTTTFKWVDGSNSTFNGFAPGEPKNTGECARTGVDGWHADNCGMASNGQFPLNLANKLPYVCESACGNGKVDPGETCDPPGPTCTKTCQKVAACTESGGMSLPENGHCYFKTSSTVSYNNALNNACAAGTHLATTDTPAETEIGLLVAGNDDIWIALSAKQTLAVFKWDILNDAIFNARRYHAFGDNDPNQDPPAGTVLTNLPPAGPVGWRDRNINTDNYKSLCERDQ